MHPRSWAPLRIVALLAVALLAVAPVARGDELELLRRALADSTRVGLLYCFYDYGDGPRWESADGIGRPAREVPHRAVLPADLQRLSRSLGEDLVALEDGPLLAHSYALEILEHGQPRLRLDLHTEGEGAGSIFVVVHPTAQAEGRVFELQLIGDGRESWLRGLDHCWEAEPESLADTLADPDTEPETFDALVEQLRSSADPHALLALSRALWRLAEGERRDVGRQVRSLERVLDGLIAASAHDRLSAAWFRAVEAGEGVDAARRALEDWLLSRLRTLRFEDGRFVPGP